MGQWTHRGLEARQGSRGGIRLWAVLTALTMVASGLMTIGGAPKASAWPAEIPHPETVSADGLPTVQINGVVWAQAIVGDTVYVGGSFTEARPAGGPRIRGAPVQHAGVQHRDWSADHVVRPRPQRAGAHDHRVPGWVDGSTSVVTSPRIAGDHAQPDRGVQHGHRRAGGQLHPERRVPRVRHLACNGSSTVYVGGNFTNVGSQYRGRLAAFNSTGTLLELGPGCLRPPGVGRPGVP